MEVAVLRLLKWLSRSKGNGTLKRKRQRRERREK
jgi:hypothetical protein